MNDQLFTTMNLREHLAATLDRVVIDVLSPSADVRVAAEKLAQADALMRQLVAETAGAGETS